MDSSGSEKHTRSRFEQLVGSAQYQKLCQIYDVVHQQREFSNWKTAMACYMKADILTLVKANEMLQFEAHLEFQNIQAFT
jgi:hypothetical protein